MTTVTSTSPSNPASSPEQPTSATPEAAPRPEHARVPLARIVAVELRKMFDTRSGFWLMCSIGILSVLATAAVVLFAPEADLDHESFAAAIGFPLVVVLPVIAILSVTSEWSQRTGLTTFTFVAHRGRVLLAKAICVVGVGVGSMLLATGIGAVGNLVGSALAGTDAVWNLSVRELALFTVGHVLGLLVGFMLGILLRSSAAAVVAYFVYSFVLTGLTALLALHQQWFADAQPWVDFNFAQGPLFEGSISAQQWTHLGVSGLIWLVVPLAVGLRVVLRSEVK